MKNTIVALVYDFDETLSTTYMQDYVLIPELGMSPKTFWKRRTSGRSTTAPTRLRAACTIL